jgi:hypothetical protein
MFWALPIFFDFLGAQFWLVVSVQPDRTRHLDAKNLKRIKSLLRFRLLLFRATTSLIFTFFFILKEMINWALINWAGIIQKADSFSPVSISRNRTKD